MQFKGHELSCHSSNHPQALLQKLSLLRASQAPGRREGTTDAGCKVTLSTSIFKQVVGVDYQVGILLIALASFSGAFQSSLGKLNQDMIIVR